MPASATTGKLGKASSLYPVETPGCLEESTASSSSSAEVTETLTLFSTVAAGCFLGEGGFNKGEVDDTPSARAVFSSRAFFSKYCLGRNRRIKNQENVENPFMLSPDLLLLQGLDDADYVFGRRGRFQLELAELRVYLGVVIEQLCLQSIFRFR